MTTESARRLLRIAIPRPLHRLGVVAFLCAILSLASACGAPETSDRALSDSTCAPSSADAPGDGSDAVTSLALSGGDTPIVPSGGGRPFGGIPPSGRTGGLPGGVSPPAGPGDLHAPTGSRGPGAEPLPGRSTPTSPSPAFPCPEVELFHGGLSHLLEEGTFGRILPRFSLAPMPAEMRDAILAHPIAALARRWDATKPRLLFGLHHYVEVDAAGAASVSSLGGWATGGALGEAVQTVYLQLVLRLLYPNATFFRKYEPPPGSDNREKVRIVHLQVNDDAEATLIPSFLVNFDKLTRLMERYGVVQMALVKPVNVLMALAGRERSRALLGLRPEQSVMHVYSQHQMYAEAKKLIGDINEKLDPDVIIYTPSYLDLAPGPRKRPRIEDELRALAQSEKRTYSRLSVLTPAAMGGRARLFVLNDMTGVMGTLYAASDRAFVLGAVNALEPIAAGTPTTILPSFGFWGNFRMLYLQSVLRQNSTDIALASGYGAVAKSVGDAVATSDALVARTRGKTPLLPPLVKGKDGRTALDRFLDHLQRVLEHEGL